MVEFVAMDPELSEEALRKMHPRIGGLAINCGRRVILDADQAVDSTFMLQRRA